jgi:ABC-type multidrug transport system ATPase subunit
MSPIIAVNSLHKHFKMATTGVPGFCAPILAAASLVRAVDGICFSIHPGELVSYLGPNGAGNPLQ